MLFLGDLDLAGLDIFIKLRGYVPHLALSALYGPMLVAAADSATSHPYSALVDKVGRSRRPAVKALSPALPMLVACEPSIKNTSPTAIFLRLRIKF